VEVTDYNFNYTASHGYPCRSDAFFSIKKR
jgi:hypothetical protein